jgi:hypothetical protein
MKAFFIKIYHAFLIWRYESLLRKYYDAYHSTMMMDINEVLDSPGKYPVRVIRYRTLFNSVLEERRKLEPPTNWKPLNG